MPGRHRAGLVAVAVALGVAIGVALDVVRVGGPEAWLAQRMRSAPAALPALSYDERGRTVQVDGRSIYLDCRGTGSPTVLLEAGFGSGASSWGSVLDGIAGFTRVCAWDRPGIGRSGDRGLHSAAETAADLRAALDAAGEDGPYVVVGHSLGGVYARIFAEGPGAPAGAGGGADAASDAVLGFVMLDTYDPDLGLADDPALDADVRAAIRAGLESTATMLQQGENLDWARTLEELAVAGPVDAPTMMLAADAAGRFPDPDPRRHEALLDAWYRGIARLYPNGRLEILPGAGHMVHLDRPTIVIDRVRELVQRFRP